MKTRMFLATLATISVAAGSVPSFAADPIPAELINVWTGAGERPIVKVLADNYEAAGGKFINTPAPTGNAVMALGGYDGELAWWQARAIEGARLLS